MVRTDGRAYGHVITKFSRMGRLPHFLSYGAPSTRALRARVELRYKVIKQLNSSFTGKLHSDHRTPLCAFSDDFINSKFWQPNLETIGGVTMSLKTGTKKMKNISSNNPAKFHAIWKILHVPANYVGEKNTYFWPSCCVDHFFLFLFFFLFFFFFFFTAVAVSTCSSPTCLTFSST